MKKWLFIALFLALPAIEGIFAQQVSIGFGLGMCKSDMSGLKTVNQNVLNSLPFDAKQIENFPAAPEYSIESVISFANRYSAGRTCR